MSTPEEVAMKSEPELATCPFCPSGGEPWLPAADHPVRCSECGAEGPTGDTDAHSVKLWNARAKVDVQERARNEENERLRGLLRQLADAADRFVGVADRETAECWKLKDSVGVARAALGETE